MWTKEEFRDWCESAIVNAGEAYDFQIQAVEHFDPELARLMRHHRDTLVAHVRGKLEC